MRSKWVLVLTIAAMSLLSSYRLLKQASEKEEESEEPVNITQSVKPVSPLPTIRSWGCSLHQTPFVFVHLGKAGGGTIRRRIAASALNYDFEAQDWRKSQFPQSYYPIQGTNGTIVKALFENSKHPSHRLAGPPLSTTYEGCSACWATTPIGHVLTCPDKNVESHSRVVYVGHNYVGTEFHWLPTSYWQSWWKEESVYHQVWRGKEETALSGLWSSIDGKSPWCGNIARPGWGGLRQQENFACRREMAPSTDAIVDAALGIAEEQDPTQRGRAYGSIYASLSTLRVTMLREPFSWLVTKFFWHGGKKTQECDHIVNATAGRNFDHEPPIWNKTLPKQPHNMETKVPGWARSFASEYVLYYCGDDCAIKLRLASADKEEQVWQEVLAQAEFNLRHSFAVVGLLEDSDNFFDMIDKRVGYVNMTQAQSIKDAHVSKSKTGERLRCGERFKETELQEQLLSLSKEIRGAVHLYQVAVEVNAFQMAELAEC